jgi:hypothetical protein
MESNHFHSSCILSRISDRSQITYERIERIEGIVMVHTDWIKKEMTHA